MKAKEFIKYICAAGLIIVGGFYVLCAIHYEGKALPVIWFQTTPVEPTDALFTQAGGSRIDNTPTNPLVDSHYKTLIAVPGFYRITLEFHHLLIACICCNGIIWITRKPERVVKMYNIPNPPLVDGANASGPRTDI